MYEDRKKLIILAKANTCIDVSMFEVKLSFGFANASCSSTLFSLPSFGLFFLQASGHFSTNIHSK
jgi:hypothetical protein